MLTKVNLAVVMSALAFAMSGASSLACLGSAQSAKATVSTPASAVIATFVVSKMECSGCEERIRNALRTVNGIYKIDVNLPHHRVVVSFDPGTVSADAIASAITDAGYYAYAEV